MAQRTYIFMGVSGSGKSTVGRAFAEAVGGVFVDGDDLHPPGNVAKMSQGTPLNDADRAGWLKVICSMIEQSSAENLCVACSALKKSYRDQLRGAEEGMTFIYLHGTRELLQRRLDERRGHFMPPGLLDSQLADLEEPSEALRVDISEEVKELVVVLREEFVL